jgi:hypothetical protein
MVDQSTVPSPFVVGVVRSGTTLLRLMLDAHPDLAIPPETHFIPTLTAACKTAADPGECFFQTVASHPRWNSWNMDRAALATAIRDVTPFTMGAALKAFYGTYSARFGKRRWGDKTPAYVSHMTLIQELLPEASFVHIIRDGRDVALSLQDVWFGPKTVDDAATMWVSTVRAARKQACELRRYQEVRYEDLVLDTEPTMKQLCRDLELPWDGAILNYHVVAEERMQENNREHWVPSVNRTISTEELGAMFRLTKKPPQASRAGRWKDEMSVADRQRFEAVAGDLLTELGYEVS